MANRTVGLPAPAPVLLAMVADDVGHQAAAKVRARTPARGTPSLTPTACDWFSSILLMGPVFDIQLWRFRHSKLKPQATEKELVSIRIVTCSFSAVTFLIVSRMEHLRSVGCVAYLEDI